MSLILDYYYTRYCPRYVLWWHFYSKSNCWGVPLYSNAKMSCWDTYV